MRVPHFFSHIDVVPFSVFLGAFKTCLLSDPAGFFFCESGPMPGTLSLFPPLKPSCISFFNPRGPQSSEISWTGPDSVFPSFFFLSPPPAILTARRWRGSALVSNDLL